MVNSVQIPKIKYPIFYSNKGNHISEWFISYVLYNKSRSGKQFVNRTYHCLSVMCGYTTSNTITHLL